MSARAAAQPTGTLTLATGFRPDPTTASGVAGGSVDAATKHPGCRGYIRAQPNHVLRAGSAFGSLRILVNGGDADTTLLVQKPDGSFACDDDSEGYDPIVRLETTAGLHRIWVGSYRPEAHSPYVIAFSESGSTTTSSIGGPSPGFAKGPKAGALDASGRRSNFGTVTLRPGFQPGLHVTPGTSGTAEGSSIDIAEVDSRCRGHVTAIPDHLFVASEDFESLTIAARSDGDTTLLVRTPDGSILCDDDGGGGRNPRVRARFGRGTYAIWVGSFSSSSNFGYRLGFSESPEFTGDEL